MKYPSIFAEKFLCMKKIIGLGNALTDVLVRLENDSTLKTLQLPKGSMQLIDSELYKTISTQRAQLKEEKDAGGSSANTIRTLGLLGVQSALIGKIGEDADGVFYQNALKECQVKPFLTIHKQLPSGVCSAFISPDGERTMATFLGASSTLSAEDLTPEMFAHQDYLYIEGYMVQNHDMMRQALSLAKQAGLQICLDLASYNIVEEDKEFFMEILEHDLDIIFANEEESIALTGLQPEEAVQEIAKKCNIAIVKVGKDGALIARGEELVRVQAFHVQDVLDTTGAGDSFAAGFMYGLAHEYDLARCGELGALMASLVIQDMGASLSTAHIEQVKAHIATWN